MADAHSLGGESALETQALYKLLDISRRLNAEVNPETILAAIVDGLVALTRADRGFVVLKGEDGSLRFAIARDREGRPLEETKFKVSRTVVDEVAESGQSRFIDDAAKSDAYQARKSIVSLSLRTILCVPLKTRGGILGVIYADSNALARRFTPRDVPLAEAFAAQAAATIERVRLQRAEIERDRMRSQLEVASEIQRIFLPGAFPEVEGVRGAVAYTPALEVGGDFYDVIRLPRGRIGVMVGDVSGKGVPGALFGARMLSDLRYEALYHDEVARTLASVNRIVAERATRGMFVTLLYAVVDPASGAVEVGNAGHLPPIVRRADGTLTPWEGLSGYPLGIVPDATYEPFDRRLERGETLLVLTDGIGDAVGEGGQRFGEERIQRVVASAPPDPAGIVSAIESAVAAFTGNRPQADDQTLLALSL
jgi:sigma-B regulation protein RsbU (phosphoserine phosphatase)